MSEVFDVVNNNSNYKELLKEFRKHRKSGEFDFEDQGRIEVLKNAGFLDKKVRQAPRGYINQVYYKITDEGLFFLRNSCFLTVNEISYIIERIKSLRTYEKNMQKEVATDYENLRKYLLKIKEMAQKLNQINRCE